MTQVSRPLRKKNRGITAMNDEIRNRLKAMIEGESNSEIKELSAMLFFSMTCMEYVGQVDPELHKRATAFAAETHGLEGVDFS